MIKVPFTKDGNIRYIELIKWTFLIAFIYAFYVLIINTSFIIILTKGLPIGSIIGVYAVINLVVVSVIQLRNILEQNTRPIIKAINNIKCTIELMIIRVSKVIETQLYNQPTNKELCVIRC